MFLAQLILQKLQNNLFTKQILAHVLLQIGTSHWQQHCKEILWWNYFCNNYRNYYKNNCSEELFCNNFGQDGISVRSPRPNLAEKRFMGVGASLILCLFLSFASRSSLYKGSVLHRLHVSSSRDWVGACHPTTHDDRVGVFHVRGGGNKVQYVPRNQENQTFCQTAKSTHHPHKTDDQHHECKNWGVAYFAFFLGSNNSHTTPPKNTTSWGRSFVGMVRGSQSPILGGISRDFDGISRPRRPKSLRNKKFVFNVWPPSLHTVVRELESGKKKEHKD